MSAAKEVFYTSPSKLEMFDICARKWWLTFIRKLPRIEHKKFAFGTIMHGAIERHLKDKPLWPDGWDIDKDSGIRLDPADTQLIQILVNKAIEDGVIERRPGGRTEEWVKLQLNERVIYRAIIDYRDIHSRLEDHKSATKTRYFKSAKKLKKDIQMMCNAKWMMDDLKRKGKVPPQIVTLAHNQFLKDYEEPLVRKREAEVTPSEIDKFFAETIVPMVQRMLEVAEKTDPFDIEDPLPSACRQYGGCDYVSICTSQETVLQFEKRITNVQQRRENPEPQKKAMTPEEFLAKKSKAAGAAAATKTEAAVNPPAPEAKEKAPQAAAVGSTEAPPWADPNCPMCSKSESPGFNPRKGSPCRICTMTTKFDTSDYEWKAVDGVITWNKKGEAAPVATVQPPEVSSTPTKTSYAPEDFLKRLRTAGTADEIVKIVAEAGEVLSQEDCNVLEDVAEAKMIKLMETPPAAEPKAEEPSPAPEPQPTPDEKPKRRTRARKPKEGTSADETVDSGALILMIGCAPISWPGKTVVMAEDILNGIDGYWQNEKVFDRRADVRKAASSGDIAELALSDLIVVQQGRDPDVDNLISSLMALKPVVIRGTIQ